MMPLLGARASTTLTVGIGGTYASLTEALEVARDGDRIELLAGTYPEGPVVLGDRALTLVGVDGAEQTVVAAGVLGLGVLQVEGPGGVAPPTITLEGLTLDGGLDTRGLYALDTHVVGRDLVFADGSDPGGGGPDVWGEGSTVELYGCDLGAPTSSQGEGGHILITSGELVVEDSNIAQGIAAGGGGGIWAVDSPVTLIRTTVSGNMAQRGGGLHFIGPGRALRIEDSVLSDNVVILWGGGLTVDASPGAQVDLIRSTLSGNGSDFDGGGADLDTVGEVSIDGCTLADNWTAGDGGALWLGSVPLVEIVGSHFEGNATVTDGGGGAIQTDNSNVVVAGSTFCGNTSNVNGGALAASSGAVEIHNSWFQQNDAAVGNAIYARSPLSIDHNVLSHNGSGSASGAVEVSGNGAATIRHNAIVANGGSGLVVDASSAVELAYNLWFDNGADAVVGGTLHGTDLEVPPGFVSLAGECDDDLHPTTGSPLIDAGDPETPDPDGSIPDIGMYGGPRAPDLVDIDADGFVADDCEPYAASAFPGGEEVPGDGLDGDCDGFEICYVDLDEDGVGSSEQVIGPAGCTDQAMAIVTGDCDDTDATRTADCSDPVTDPTPGPDPGAPAPSLPPQWFCAHRGGPTALFVTLLLAAPWRTRRRRSV